MKKFQTEPVLKKNRLMNRLSIAKEKAKAKLIEQAKIKYGEDIKNKAKLYERMYKDKHGGLGSGA